MKTSISVLGVSNVTICEVDLLQLLYSISCIAGDCSQDIELDGTTDNIKIELHHILRFCTGADGIPPTGFHKQIDMEFFSVRDGTKPLPIASTCGLELHLPRGVEDTKFFADMMMEAILCSPGFGKM